MDFIKTIFNPSYGYVRGIVGIILGLILIIFPTASIKFLVWVIGGIILLSGIVSLLTYFIHRNKIVKGTETIELYSNDRMLLITGIIASVIGLFLLLFSSVLINFVVTIFGILLIVMAIMQLLNLFKAAKSENNLRYVFLFPIATLVLGILCTVQPQGATRGAVIILGFGILMAGASEFVSVMKLKEALKHLKEQSQ